MSQSRPNSACSGSPVSEGGTPPSSDSKTSNEWSDTDVGPHRTPTLSPATSVTQYSPSRSLRDAQKVESPPPHTDKFVVFLHSATPELEDANLFRFIGYYDKVWMLWLKWASAGHCGVVTQDIQSIPEEHYRMLQRQLDSSWEWEGPEGDLKRWCIFLRFIRIDFFPRRKHLTVRAPTFSEDLAVPLLADICSLFCLVGNGHTRTSPSLVSRTVISNPNLECVLQHATINTSAQSPAAGDTAIALCIFTQSAEEFLYETKKLAMALPSLPSLQGLLIVHISQRGTTGPSSPSRSFTPRASFPPGEFFRPEVCILSYMRSQFPAFLARVEEAENLRDWEAEGGNFTWVTETIPMGLGEALPEAMEGIASNWRGWSNRISNTLPNLISPGFIHEGVVARCRSSTYALLDGAEVEQSACLSAQSAYHMGESPALVPDTAYIKTFHHKGHLYFLDEIIATQPWPNMRARIRDMFHRNLQPVLRFSLCFVRERSKPKRPTQKVVEKWQKLAARDRAAAAAAMAAEAEESDEEDGNGHEDEGEDDEEDEEDEGGENEGEGEHGEGDQGEDEERHGHQRRVKKEDSWGSCKFMGPSRMHSKHREKLLGRLPSIGRRRRKKVEHPVALLASTANLAKVRVRWPHYACPPMALGCQAMHGPLDLTYVLILPEHFRLVHRLVANNTTTETDFIAALTYMVLQLNQGTPDKPEQPTQIDRMVTSLQTLSLSCYKLNKVVAARWEDPDLHAFPGLGPSNNKWIIECATPPYD
ncbi:uncharacterized protein B0H18DRAFT_1124253 [Fomitopsis serialis]|uniref:uncharacterized protein n=1 Tax=Fomitopsis serialis TaxID=139415 RepID=UPI002008BD46|nr:uncharacterized protein B0H18DRAFT_1124253 [Neoantrodia serialis]KAH9916349.1 hypothetical protein B0H18DRAFT_1124253 [Neoantrodia serialis]